MELKKTETQIVGIYLCQMLGCPTIDEIQEVMKNKMGIKANKIEIKNAINSAKKRGLVSINHIQDPKTGNIVDGYSMKDLRWTNPPEVAHIKNVLPKLLESKETKEIYEAMEGVHTKGKTKGGRLPDIRDYVTWEVEFENIVPVLGGQPSNDKSEEKGVQATNKHRRIGKQIWIPGNLMVRTAIKSHLREYNIGDSKALYIKASDYFFTPIKKTEQVICSSPPQRAGQPGTGLTSYEGLQPGEKFVFTIKFPTKNGIPEEVMKNILEEGIRIGARHKDYGLLKVNEIRRI